MPGVDSLRFILALWVVINHVGAPPLLPTVPRTAALAHPLRSVFENVFNGQAAVAMFFVISGFCIHFPFRGARAIASVPRYYARRNIRIILPAVAAAVLSREVGIELANLHHSILWSLVCEEIYYFIYPALRWIAARIGWAALLASAAASSLVPLALQPNFRYLSDFGLAGTWFVGLPYWLVGCVIAERVESNGLPSPPSATRLWGLRVAMLAAASASSLLLFHSPVGLPWTLPVVAGLGAPWFLAEVGRSLRDGSGRLERLGTFSYSIYLFHSFAWRLLQLNPTWAEGSLLEWSATLAAIVMICWVAYLVVERPTHRLARRISRIGFDGSLGLGTA